MDSSNSKTMGQKSKRGSESLQAGGKVCMSQGSRALSKTSSLTKVSGLTSHATSSAQPSRACVCLWGELRGVRQTRDSLYQNLIEPLDADVVLLCQRTFEDDDARLALFEQRLRRAVLYDREDIFELFGASNCEALQRVEGNWLGPLGGRRSASMHIYANFKKYADLLDEGTLLQDFDLWVFVRSDLLLLFPVPPLSMLFSAIGSKDILTCEKHEWGGINFSCITIMRRSIVLKYLNAPFEWLTDSNKRSLLMKHTRLNIESFWAIIFEGMGWRNLKMSSMAFITAESIDDRTTWAPITFYEKFGVLGKYDEQVEIAHRNSCTWKKGARWTLDKVHLRRIEVRWRPAVGPVLVLA